MTFELHWAPIALFRFLRIESLALPRSPPMHHSAAPALYRKGGWGELEKTNHPFDPATAMLLAGIYLKRTNPTRTPNSSTARLRPPKSSVSRCWKFVACPPR